MNLNSYKNIKKLLETEDYDLESGLIVEMGEQTMNRDLRDFLKTDHVLFSTYRRSCGSPILSIDTKDEIEGDQVVALDFSQPLPEEYLNTFDLLTNFGISEHIFGQYMVWKNMADLVKVGGLLYHEVPFDKTWPGHGHISYNEGFFKKMQDFGFDPIDISYSYGEKGRTLITVVHRKKRSTFPSERHFGTPWLINSV